MNGCSRKYLWKYIQYFRFIINGLIGSDITSIKNVFTNFCNSFRKLSNIELLYLKHPIKIKEVEELNEFVDFNVKEPVEGWTKKYILKYCEETLKKNKYDDTMKVIKKMKINKYDDAMAVIKRKSGKGIQHSCFK